MYNRYQNLMFNIEDLSDRCPGFDEYNRLLGKNGYCYGLVHMWGRAILLPDTKGRRIKHNGSQEKVFENRLNILTRNYNDNPLSLKTKKYKYLSAFLKDNILPIEKMASNFKGTGRLNYYSMACRETGISLKDYKLYISIRTFLDGLLLYQNPYSVHDKGYLLYDEQDEDTEAADHIKGLGVQSAKVAAKYVGPGERSLSGSHPEIMPGELSDIEHIGIVEVYNRPYVMGRSISHKTTFINLMEYAQEVSSRFYICISSVNHAVGLVFKHDQFKVYDANLMTNQSYRVYFRTVPLEEISSEIMRRFDFNVTNGLLPINISIFSTALTVYDSSILLKVYGTYERNELFNIIRKRRYINTLFLYVACQHGHEQIVATLLKCSRINVDQHQVYGGGDIADTPIYVACQNGYVGIVKRLLAVRNIKLDQAKKDGSTPLHAACKHGHVKVASLLLQTRKVDVNKSDETGVTPFYIACQNGHIEVVALLLGVSSVKVNLAEEDEVTPFFIACQNGHVEVVKILLGQTQVDINQVQEYGLSPFYIACQNGHVEIIDELCRCARLKVDTPELISKCFIAACGAKKGALQILSNKWSGHDINASFNMVVNYPHTETLTPLIQACYQVYEESILWLLDSYKGRIKDDVVFKGKNALGWYLEKGGTNQLIIEKLKLIES